MFNKLSYLIRRSGRRTLSLLTELRRSGYSTSDTQSLLKEIRKAKVKPKDVRNWGKQKREKRSRTPAPDPVPPVAPAHDAHTVTESPHDAETLGDFGVFLYPQARALNEARLVHLASLGLDLGERRVLEAGGGVGLLTPYWECQGCRVLFTDGRAENVAEAKRRNPGREVALLDLDNHPVPESWGAFDVVFCYGLLYHLSEPTDAIRKLAQACSGVMVLETCVSPGSETALNPISEPSEIGNQARSGLGCRPTRAWVWQSLKAHFPHVYTTSTQPAHEEFVTDWDRPGAGPLYRAVFVASRQPLTNPFLLESLPMKQFGMRERSCDVWLDVGAHLGQNTRHVAESDPRLNVYAFEANSSLAGQVQGRLPNYHSLALAVGSHNGYQKFRFNAIDACSSLLPLNQAAKEAWKGGELLAEQGESLVPVIRLDSFLNASGISQVDFLKIDTQGVDHQVLIGAGDRLSDIAKVTFEAVITPTQLYEGAHGIEETTRLLVEAGFVQIAADFQSHDQEINATFVKSTHWRKDQLCPYVSDDALNDAASRMHRLRKIAPWPEYDLGVGLGIDTPDARIRRTLWTAASKRHIDSSFTGQWLKETRVNYYLGRDLSLATFLVTFDPNEFAFLHTVIKPGMRIVDVGANEGMYSVFFAASVGPEGVVFAIEPSERESQRLAANVDLNGFGDRVRICRKAASDKSERVQFKLAGFGHEGQNTLGDFFWNMPSSNGVVEVDCAPLDEVREICDSGRIDIIKIDVEGAEWKALKGARSLIERDKPLVLFEVNEAALAKQHAKREDLYAFFNSLGYSLYGFSAQTGRPTPVNEGILAGENIIASPHKL